MVCTGELLSVSHSSVLLPRVYVRRQSYLPCYNVCTNASTSATNSLLLTTTSNLLIYRPVNIKRQSKKHFSSVVRQSVVPEKVPTAFSADIIEGTDIQLDNSGGGGDIGGGKGNNWGGGGGGDSEGAANDGEKEPKKTGMSMSQKLTLGYAALVGLGGLMGYLKSGSQKSLISGGVSAALLYYVYTQLPVNPVFASCIGFGLSAALLVVMGTRFKKSGKVFPAGVVSVVSLVMTGGYVHGIMRGFH
ncbi:uncharacterized protein [Rutidosis leptorrhynchoides]|uniref:uncharacterized protein n=1 Tax=Rutidosis leptorrhynchoides TaxID=125765 RepID=UPI003A98D066